MLTELISTFLQILAFALIPFIVYLIQKRTFRGFFDYIGLHGTTRKANWMALGVSLFFIAGAMGIALFNSEIKEVLNGPQTVAGKIRAMGWGWESVLMILLMAGLKTSFSEEILFRGFIAKRLMAWLGYQWGNIIQSVIFGLVHLLLFWAITQAGWVFLVFIFVFSGMAAYLIGYIKEKHGKGSIIPGWIAHGTGNVVAYTVLAFVI